MIGTVLYCQSEIVGICFGGLHSRFRTFSGNRKIAGCIYCGAEINYSCTLKSRAEADIVIGINIILRVYGYIRRTGPP